MSRWQARQRAARRHLGSATARAIEAEANFVADVPFGYVDADAPLMTDADVDAEIQRRMAARRMTPPPIPRECRPTSAPPPWKTCTKCGGAISADAWHHLPFIGLQDDGAGGYLELRNHDCDTTLSTAVSA